MAEEGALYVVRSGWMMGLLDLPDSREERVWPGELESCLGSAAPGERARRTLAETGRLAVPTLEQGSTSAGLSVRHIPLSINHPGQLSPSRFRHSGRICRCTHSSRPPMPSRPRPPTLVQIHRPSSQISSVPWPWVSAPPIHAPARAQSPDRGIRAPPPAPAFSRPSVPTFRPPVPIGQPL